MICKTSLTFEEYQKCKKFIFDTLEVHQRVALPYVWVLIGSLHFEWNVTARAIPHMAVKKKEALINNSYVLVQLGETQIYNVRDTQNKIKVHLQYIHVKIHIHVLRIGYNKCLY